MKCLFVLLLLLAAATAAIAQTTGPAAYDPTVRYPVAQLLADLTYVRRALEEAHPGLYLYSSKDSLDKAFARTAAELTQPLDEPTYWQTLQRLVAQVHCGHTRVQLSPAYRAWFRRQPHSYFPFTVAVRQNRLFVATNQSTTTALRPGTEVLAIDGHPTAEILPGLRALISADGYGTGFQDAELEAGYFDEYYWHLYPARPHYPLLVRDSTGQSVAVTPQWKPRAVVGAAGPAGAAAPALPAAQERTDRLARLRAVRYPTNMPATAILRVRSFSYDEDEDYKRFHATLFADLARRRVRHLVIDLRGNPGGNNEIAIDLLRYLLKAEFVHTKTAAAPVGLPSFMQPDRNRPAYFDTTQVRRRPDGTYAFTAATVGRQKPYRKHYFRGKVVLLIDGGTFSAASSFAASLRAQRRISILGQESGGTEAGLNGGVISRLELPNTHLVLQLPHFRLLTACRNPLPGRGVRPDQEVVPTPEQVATQTDAALLQLEKRRAR